MPRVTLNSLHRLSYITFEKITLSSYFSDKDKLKGRKVTGSSQAEQQGESALNSLRAF